MAIRECVGESCKSKAKKKKKKREKPGLIEARPDSFISGLLRGLVGPKRRKFDRGLAEICFALGGGEIFNIHRGVLEEKERKRREKRKMGRKETMPPRDGRPHGFVFLVRFTSLVWRLSLDWPLKRKMEAAWREGLEGLCSGNSG